MACLLGDTDIGKSPGIAVVDRACGAVVLRLEQHILDICSIGKEKEKIGGMEASLIYERLAR
jgi:hypothetical protein